ncbi:MAG TPA: NAD-binding protein, partial [Arthrobacter sp.]|nr:NAD-binding protein [Arthrobacter sp.]
ANSEVLRQKGQRWIGGDFEGGGSAKNQLKDLNFIAEIAKDAGLTLPLSSSVRGAFELMIAAGDGDLDHTGIYRTVLGQSVWAAGGGHLRSL